MIQRITDYVIGGLLVVVLIYAGYSKYQSWRAESIKEDAQHYAGNAKAHEVAAVEYRTIITERKKADEALDRALERNPEWADEPVPSDVADLLRHDSGAARAVP